MKAAIFIFLATLLFPASLHAQTSLSTPIIEDDVYFDPRDTIHLPHLGQNEILNSILNITMKRRSVVSRSSTIGTLADDTPFYIPVKIWVYRNDDGSNPALSDSDVHALLDSVNRRYAAGGTGIQFYMRCPISHVYSTRFNYVNNDVEFWAATSIMLRHDSYALNWHLVRNWANSTVGEAFYPWSTVGDPFSLAVQHGGVLSPERVITTVHEIGHALGVLHTHDNTRGTSSYNGDATDCYQESVSRTRRQKIGCLFSFDSKKCSINGDALCDTEAAPNTANNKHIAVDGSCSYAGSGSDNWGEAWRPPTTNYMSYVSTSTCRSVFTQGQIAVMHMSIMQYMVNAGAPWYNLHSITLSGTVNSGGK